MTNTRRDMIWAGGIIAVAGAGLLSLSSRGGAKPQRAFPLTLTDAEWRNRLSPAAYRTLRHEATEAPYTSPLNGEHRPGTFVCAGCALPLYSATTKFESGTGWPSFWKPLPGAIGTRQDRTLGFGRTEVHCARCGGHLGHVFDDGPKSTGLRYCMNGIAMRFVPAKA